MCLGLAGRCGYLPHFASGWLQIASIISPQSVAVISLAGGGGVLLNDVPAAVKHFLRCKKVFLCVNGCENPRIDGGKA
jgi:hypothetical protein